MRSKVMKVLAKSLKNATEQHDKPLFKLVEMLIKFKCAFNFSYVYHENEHLCVLC